MSTQNKILLIVLVIIVGVVGFTYFKTKKGVETKSAKKTTTAPNASLEKQSKEEASVTVDATPKTLKVGQNPVFEIAFDTHTVDLSFDMVKTVVLLDDKGTTYSVKDWDGPGPGGHHLSGNITFDTPLSQTKYVELVVKEVSGVKERKFKWNL